MLDYDVANYIVGEMLGGNSGRVVESFNPANGELLASVCYASI
jgi:hypothetical protein